MAKKVTLFDVGKLLFVAIGALIMAVPFIWLVLTTFKNNQEIITFPPRFFPEKWRVENYIYIIDRFNIAKYFFNSLYLSSVRTAIGLYTSLYCGYVLAKFNFKGRSTLFGTTLFTMMVPYLIMVIPLYNMMNKFNWIDSYLAIVAPAILSSFGIFMMRQYMISGVPNELIEAARIDGATEFRIFHTVAIPLSANMISALGIFLFLWNWEDFLWPYLILITQSKFPLAVALNMFSGRNVINYGPLFAATLVTILPITIVYLFFQRRFIEGISMTGIK